MKALRTIRNWFRSLFASNTPVSDAFLRGAGSIVDLGGVRRRRTSITHRTVTDQEAWQQDADNIRKDFEAVGRDMWKVIDRVEK